jgi:autotransporter-associated beta strand protein/T5SS/PEP-CTERM-associated repeat protein
MQGTAPRTSVKSRSPRAPHRLAQAAIAAAAAILAGADSAKADLTHRYSFNDGTANDSIGGANGTLINPDGLATITGGQVNFANNGVNNNVLTGHYVDLPNGLGATSSFTIEGWATWNGGNAWQRFFDFGANTGGEETPGSSTTGYTGTSYCFVTPMTGNDPGNGRINNLNGEIRLDPQSTFVNARNASNQPFAYGTGAEHMFALTKNAGDNTLNLYYDGKLVGSATGFLDPSSINMVNVWLGRSNWQADPFYNGSIDEFRIYDNPLPADQILAHSGYGPDSLGPSGTNIWQTAGAGNFGNAGSWSQNHVPNSTEQAIINNAATVTVNSNVGTNVVTQIANGTLTFIAGGSLVASIDLAPGNGPGTATLNLNGGVLTVQRILVDTANPSGNAAKSINFNGGTLATSGSFTLSGSNLATTVGASGATIDTQGASIVVWTPALTPTAAGASLTKLGTGTLNLTGGGFLGPVSVKAGTLSVAGNVGTASANLQIGDPSVTGGTSATLALSTNAAVLSPIVVGVPGSPGTYGLSVSGNATVSIAKPITMNQPLTISSVAATGSNALSITGGINSASSTPNTLTFNNAGPVVVSTAGITETAGGPLSVVKNNTGVVLFAAPNTYTGPTTINTGGVLFAAPNTIGGTGQTVTVNANGVAGAGPGFDYTNLKGTFFNRIVPTSAGVLALTQNSAENFDFSASGLNFTGASLGAGAGSNVTYTGTLTPNGSTYRLGGGGGTLTLPNTNAITGANDLLVAGAGGGTVALPSPNDFSGTVTVRGGNILSVSNQSALGTGATPILLSGGGIGITGSTPVTITRPIALSDGDDTIRVDNTAGATFSGGISIAGNANVNNSPLHKTGPGTATLTGTVDVGRNSIWVNQGTLLFDTGSTVTSSFFNSIGQLGTDVGTVIAQGSSQYTVRHDFNVGDVGNAKGFLFIKDNAQVQATTFYDGKFNSTQGVVVQTGGSLTFVPDLNNGGPGEWRIGGGGGTGDVAAIGTYDMTGGTLTTPGNFQVGAFGTGGMLITGGTATANTYPAIGRFPGGYGILTITGTGSFNQIDPARLMIVGEQGTGILNLSGGGTLTSGATTILGLNQGFGEVNLGAGGTLAAPQIALGSGTGIFNFHGGTLTPTIDGPNFFSSVTAAYIYSEGAVIDTNGHSVQIAQNLTAPSGSGVASIAVTNGGSGYVAHPVVQLTGGGGTGAAAVAIVTNGVITGFQITNPGVGYTGPVTVNILGGGGAGAAAGTINLAPVSGGGLTKVGDGFLTLTGANTYTGDTTVNVGTLVQGASGAIPTGPGFGNVVVNGGATTAGTFDINGLDTNINGLSGAAGAVAGMVTNNNPGTAVTLTVGNADASATFNGAITDGAGTLNLTKIGAGTQTLAGVNTYTGPTLVNAGTLKVSGSIANSSSVSVLNGSTFEAAATQRVKKLVVFDGTAKVTRPVASGSTRTVLIVGDGIAPDALSITPSAKMDLTVNALAVDYPDGSQASTIQSVRDQIISGYNGGNWQGNGITTSSPGRSIGYAQASEILGPAGGNFLGADVDGTTVVARATRPGDANLDGKVDFTDLVAVAQNYGATVSSTTDSWWTHGDFNYDGKVNFGDLVTLAQNYGSAEPGAPIPGAPEGFAADTAAAFASVPEPASVAAFGFLAACGFAPRRRRKRPQS